MIFRKSNKVNDTSLDSKYRIKEYVRYDGFTNKYVPQKRELFIWWNLPKWGYECTYDTYHNIEDAKELIDKYKAADVSKSGVKIHKA
jgi:hypothetical protein